MVTCAQHVNVLGGSSNGNRKAPPPAQKNKNDNNRKNYQYSSSTNMLFRFLCCCCYLSHYFVLKHTGQTGFHTRKGHSQSESVLYRQKPLTPLPLRLFFSITVTRSHTGHPSSARAVPRSSRLPGPRSSVDHATLCLPRSLKENAHLLELLCAHQVVVDHFLLDHFGHQFGTVTILVSHSAF